MSPNADILLAWTKALDISNVGNIFQLYSLNMVKSTKTVVLNMQTRKLRNILTLFKFI